MDGPSDHDSRRAREGASRHAEVAALPLAAAATLALARALPIEFRYRPNALGIVSRATLDEYPLQQETFWFAFAVVFGIAAVVGIAAWLRRSRWSTGRGMALEGAALALLAALLFLPAAFTALALLPLAAVVALVRTAPARGAQATASATERVEPPRSPRARRAWWLAALLVLALGASPELPIQLERTLTGVPDAQLTTDDWGFHGEMGQHLASADAIVHGRMQGRDYFSLYGPYLDLGLVGLWKLAGRSLAAANLYVGLLFAAGYLGALVACWTLCKRRWAALALVPLARPISLRYGLDLFGVAALAPWVRGGARAWCGLAGLVCGFALLFSQEFGLAFLLTAALALVVRGDLRALAWFGAGLIVPIAPIAAWFAAEGALAPLLRDVASYPAWVAAGYGKLPFPSLLAALPLDASDAGAPALRAAYVTPAVCAGAFALCATAAPLVLARAWRFPLELRSAWRAAPEVLLAALIAAFGLVSFRSALGRSDALHLGFVSGGPAVLLVLALDRTLPLFADARTRALGAWRVLCLYGLAWFGGFPAEAASLGSLARFAANGAHALAGPVEAPKGSAVVDEVAAWIRAHTAPDDTVAFIPAGAGYQYLTERRDPTRFLLSHQMVTDAHRAEALADFERRPPRYVVLDPRAMRVDGVPDHAVLGAALEAWLDGHYEAETAIRGVKIRRRKADASAPPDSAAAHAAPEPK